MNTTTTAAIAVAGSNNTNSSSNATIDGQLPSSVFHTSSEHHSNHQKVTKAIDHL